MKCMNFTNEGESMFMAGSGFMLMACSGFTLFNTAEPEGV